MPLTITTGSEAAKDFFWKVSFRCKFIASKSYFSFTSFYIAWKLWCFYPHFIYLEIIHFLRLIMYLCVNKFNHHIYMIRFNYLMDFQYYKLLGFQVPPFILCSVKTDESCLVLSHANSTQFCCFPKVFSSVISCPLFPYQTFKIPQQVILDILYFSLHPTEQVPRCDNMLASNCWLFHLPGGQWLVSKDNIQFSSATEW